MKNIILWIPAFLFPLFALLPIIIPLYINIDQLFAPVIRNSFILVSHLSILIWTLSLAEYMSNEAKNKNYLWLIYLVSSLEFILLIIATFNLPIYWKFLQGLPFGMIFFVLIIIHTFFLTKIVKRVFYARSYYFIVIEILIPFIGMYTLTSEVKEWEKEKSNEINIV